MSKRRRKLDPNALRPGDFLHLKVPPNRNLATGVYRARVESLAPKERHRDRILAHCVVVINDLDFDDYDAIVIHFQLTIYPRAPHLACQCFLGDDQFPVEFRREDNLLQRLADSLPPKERTPYADS